MRGSRRGENAILSDNQLRHTIASSQSNNLLHGGQRQVAAITPHHQCRTTCAARYRRKNALHKVLRVVLLLKHGDTLTQTRGSRLLSFKRLGSDRLDRHHGQEPTLTQRTRRICAPPASLQARRVVLHNST